MIETITLRAKEVRLPASFIQEWTNDVVTRHFDSLDPLITETVGPILERLLVIALGSNLGFQSQAHTDALREVFLAEQLPPLSQLQELPGVKVFLEQIEDAFLVQLEQVLPSDAV